MAAEKQSAETIQESQGATQDAVAIILKHERQRKRRVARNARRRRHQAERAHHAAMDQMRQSMEVIKWCVLSISAVMLVSLVIGLVVLNEIQNEAERIKTEVTAIQREAEMIREKIRHPLESLGGTLGRQLDSKVGEMLGGEE